MSVFACSQELKDGCLQGVLNLLPDFECCQPSLTGYPVVAEILGLTTNCCNLESWSQKIMGLSTPFDVAEQQRLLKHSPCCAWSVWIEISSVYLAAFYLGLLFAIHPPRSWVLCTWLDSSLDTETLAALLPVTLAKATRSRLLTKPFHCLDPLKYAFLTSLLCLTPLDFAFLQY